MQTIGDYVCIELLGRGTYGEVFKAVNQKIHSTVAVKRVSKRNLCKRAQDNLVDEIGILKNLNHRNIAQMVDFTWDQDHVYMYMEYLAGGDLSRFLKSRRKLPEGTIRYFLQQLAFALHYLFERNIVHMDIKPQNILLTPSSPPTLKLTDFGFAKSLEEPVKMNEIRGSLLYMAPEIFNFGVYEKSCDLWSVGVIFYECLFGGAPFASTTVEELKVKLADDSSIKIPSTPAFSNDCIDLVSRLLKRNPQQRIQHEQFFVHPFIDLVHAPCPQSLSKAVDFLVKAEDLNSTGNLVDAYLNYKEGLTHMISALHFEEIPSRKLIIRSKLSFYMGVAEDLNRRLQNGEPEHQPPPRPARPTPSLNIHPGKVTNASSVRRSTNRREGGSSVAAVKPALGAAPPSPGFSVSSMANVARLEADSQTVREVTDSRSVPPEVRFRSIGLIASWFSNNHVGGGSTNENESPPPAIGSTTSGTESTISVVVKTAHEYALARIDALEELSSRSKANLGPAITGLRRFYTLLNLNEFKSALDYVQSTFGIWLAVVKGETDPELQKMLRSELNDALTAAEKLKSSLQRRQESTPIPEDVDVSKDTCFLS